MENLLFVVFMWTHVQFQILRPRGLAVSEPQVVNCVTLHVTCDLFSNSFNSHLQLLKSAGVGAVQTRSLRRPKRNSRRDSCPVNIVAGTTHVRSPLEIESTGHGYQTHHAACPRRHSLYVSVHHPVEKCWVHIA